MGPGADRLIAEDAARHDHPEWRLAALHFPHLDGTGMGAQQEVGIPLDEEGVLHVPGRVLFREIESGEDMPIVFDFRTIGHGETHPIEDGQDLPAHDIDGVVGTQRGLPARAGVVGPATRCVLLGRQRRLGGIKMGLERLLERVEGLAHLALLRSGNGAEALIQILEQALPTEMGDAKRLQLFRIVEGRGLRFGEQPIEFGGVQC